jgi:hypothetical protein
MKNKLRLLAAVLIAGGTMFAQSRQFVGNSAAGYGSGSNSHWAGSNYNQQNNNNNNAFRDNNVYRNNAVRVDDRRPGFGRSYNNDRFRRDDRGIDYRDRNRWDERRHVVVDDYCRR